MALNVFFDATLGRVLSLPQPLGLFLISFFLTLALTLVYKWMTDQKLMKSLKEEMTAMRGEMKQYKQDTQKMMELNKKVWDKNMVYLKHSLKPNLITLIPIIIIFSWLRSYYEGLGNPTIFLGLSWLWTYIIFSLVLSMLIRKLLKVH